MTIRGDKFQSIGLPVTQSFVFANEQGPPSQSLIYRWHKAESPNVTLVSGKVSQWDDLSGKDNHLTQSVASNRPTWIESTSSFNAQSAVQFDGVNDFMVDLHTALTGSGITFALSFRKNGVQNNVDGIMGFTKPGARDFDSATRFNYNEGRKSPLTLDDEIEIGPNTDTSDNIFLADAASAKTEQVIVRMEGDPVDVLKQLLTGSVGTHVSASNLPAAWDITKAIIGARDPQGNESILHHIRADYFEIIVYQAALNDAEMGALDNYMSASLAGGLTGSGAEDVNLNTPRTGVEQGKLAFTSFINQKGFEAASLNNAPSASNPTFWVPVETPSGSGVVPIWT